MLYEVKNGTVSLGGNEILSHFNFRMVDNEKIGIVGRNGAGKTTLLKLMNDEVHLDYNDDNTIGEIVKSKDFNCGYLKQQLAEAESIKSLPTMTVYSYLLEAFTKLLEMERKIEILTNELEKEYDEKKTIELNTMIDTYNFEGGYTYLRELKTGFKKFGFNEDDLQRPISEFSGGQSTKISLLKLLLSKPDVLMLDEPTNHLDISAIEWTENYLKNYKKNIVVVSHDRMFLDNICNVIYDVENKETVRYDGNYTDFVAQKKINYELKLAEYNKNLKEIERLTELADRFRYKATKAKMVQSKDKVIEKLKDKTFKPVEADTKTFHVKIVPNKAGGKEVLRCEDLMIGYSGDERGNVANESVGNGFQYKNASHIITKVNLLVNRGDRLAVIGANGTGKSTFIKTIVGVLPKISGEYNFGHEISYEYFDQRIAENSSVKTLFDDFSDEFPSYDNTAVRNRLGRFLFDEEDIVKRVCDLSGGEKVRLSLAKIFERKPNLLILDEPTNHLDILGKESLEEIIESFEGTVIFVSHDRYFVKKIASKVLLFESNDTGSNMSGTCNFEVSTRFFEFGYDDYEKYESEKMTDEDSESVVAKSHNVKIKEKDSENKLNYEEKKLKNRDEKKAKKLENEIAGLEAELKALNEKLEDSSIASNFEELSKLQHEIDEKNSIIEKKYAEWADLQ